MILKIAHSKKKFDVNLESLRGFAALFVVFQHLFDTFNNWLDSNYQLRNILDYHFPGHFSVLLFFVLSGYVIGVSHKERLTGSHIGMYLKKRWVRLYPIYLVCVLLTLLVAYKPYSVISIFGHLTFTQVLFTPVFNENTALWSLNFEVLFYLLFIPVSYCKINPVLITGIVFGIGITNQFLFSSLHTPLISTYAYGFTFWLFGLIIARYFTLKETDVSYSQLLGSVFLILAFGGGIFDVLVRLFDTVNQFFHYRFSFPGSVNWYNQAITFYDFSLLPYCLLFIVIFAEKKFAYKNVIAASLLLLPLLAVPHIIKSHIVKYELIVPAVCYLVSLFLFTLKINFLDLVSRKIIAFGSWIGGLSYGLYVIHLPVLFAFSRINIFSGYLSTYVLRVVLYFTVIIVLSFLLEKRLQKGIKNFFFKKRDVSLQPHVNFGSLTKKQNQT